MALFSAIAVIVVLLKQLLKPYLNPTSFNFGDKKSKFITEHVYMYVYVAFTLLLFYKFTERLLMT